MLEARATVVERRNAILLRGVTAQFRSGQVTAICGPNGAGKSTLLAALAGLEPKTRRTVFLGGEPLAGLSSRQRAQAIGYLPQGGEVAWNLDVKALAGLGRLPWSSPAHEDEAAVTAALAGLGLEGLADRQVGSLSGGERARALLARVLAGTPRWILADEPLAALDLAHQLALLERFKALAAAGTGVVLVLHDLALAMNHADRVVVLSDGLVAAEGAPVQALSERVIGQVWGVRARWLGGGGEARALATG